MGVITFGVTYVTISSSVITKSILEKTGSCIDSFIFLYQYIDKLKKKNSAGQKPK